MTQANNRGISFQDETKLEVQKPQKLESTNLNALPVVVGVGASAGGLDALKSLFSAMPPDTGLVFVIAQHLNPHHESLTTTLMSNYTLMPVVTIENKMHIEPNHIYVVPPDKVLKMVDNFFVLEPLEEKKGNRTSLLQNYCEWNGSEEPLAYCMSALQ